MPTLAIQITRFVDEHQPGFVECVFEDAQGNAHVVIEKVPVFTGENLSATSVYPRAGAFDCECIASWKDVSGRALVKIDTDRPWHIETTTGETQFVVLASQVAG